MATAEAIAEDLDRGGIAGHPKGLSTLFLTEMWERFSYYGMRSLLILFMTAPVAAGGLGFSDVRAATIYGLYTGSAYFTTIPGGYIADRLLGLRRAVLVGAVLIALGHYCLILKFVPTFFTGLVLIALGTGLLKANISSIVGQLYAPQDTRRDAGFSIFYMGINLGALSPLICGYLGQKVGWHWGFGAAGFGMTLGLVQFMLGSSRLGHAGLLVEKPKGAGLLWARVVLSVAVLGAALWALWDHRNLVVLGGTVLLFAWLLRQAQNAQERKKMGAIMALFVFAIVFWVGYEQAGSSLNLFADRYTHNTLLGYDFPSAWYQWVEPLFIILLAPVFAWLWMRLGRFEPSSPAKFAWGLLFLGLGYLPVALAARLFAESHVKVSPFWLVFLYLFHAFGELSLSPVGLSTVTKLAPVRVAGLMMGVWFLALSIGNFLGGEVAGLMGSVPLPTLFGGVFLALAASAVVLALLSSPIRSLMGGVH